jgi:hypothetical protein
MTDGAARAEAFGKKPRTPGSFQLLFDVENPREAAAGNGRTFHHRTDAFGRPSRPSQEGRGPDETGRGIGPTGDRGNQRGWRKCLEGETNPRKELIS